MNPIKELNERRGVKIKDADTIVAKAIAEKRELTAQENEQVCALHAEADNLAESAKNMQRQMDLNAGVQPLGLSDKEVREYSVARAIERRAASMKGEGVFDGLEAEASAAIAKRRGVAAQGFFIPVEITQGAPEKRNLVAGTTTAGGFTVPTDLGLPIIELLRNRAVVASLGAQVITGITGNVAIPRQTGAATASWLSETAQVSKTNQTFGQLALTPKRLAARSGYSLQLLRQSSIAVEGFIRNDQASVLAIAIDLAAIQGTGSSGQPTGIVNTSGIGSFTFGGAPTYAKYIEAIAAMLSANSLAGMPAFLGSPSSWTKGKTTTRDTGSGVFIIGADNTVDGYRWAPSNHLPSNRLILGDFSQLIIAYFGEPDVVVDPFTNADLGVVNVTTNHFVDIGVRQAASFVVSTDSAAQ